jgi:hypothetical protein
MARAFIDCTSSFRTGRGSLFPCELPYLHDGDHRCSLSGEETRIVFYGNGLSVLAETVVTWKPAHDDYRYFEREEEWLRATSDDSSQEGE